MLELNSGLTSDYEQETKLGGVTYKTRVVTG